MKKFENISEAAEIKVSYIPKRTRAIERKKLLSSKEVYNYLLSGWDEGEIEYIESFKVLYCDTQIRVIGVQEVSRGGLESVVVDIRQIFATALKTRTCKIIIAHNHPSGTLRPSEADKRLTQNIKEAGDLLNIPLLDHLIITPTGYYSFADNLEL